MIDCLLFGATVLAVLGSGLIAGVFFGFAAFMLKAISRLPVPQGIAAMQSITTAIKNSLFLMLFFATAALAGMLARAGLDTTTPSLPSLVSGHQEVKVKAPPVFAAVKTEPSKPMAPAPVWAET